MAQKDLIYSFDKITHIGSAFGEIQTGFNMSFTIDGTKDSCKVEVYSFNGEELEPNTIIFHKKTNTWWIVSQDKVERYLNESGYLYVHNLQLEGAIELLNARDLTDCGFDQKTYTVRLFIDKLFRLSTFEYTLNYDTNNIENNFLDKVVDFIKTFENYTLLSALREFLDAYNSCPKMIFVTTYNSTNDKYTITSAYLRIIPKTGSTKHNFEWIEESFDDVRETKVLSKESFGTCVVSNAENVISTQAKTYPSTGAMKTSGTKYIIKAEDAVIRLPSKVFKGNWLAIVGNIAPIEADGTIGDTVIGRTQTSFHINPVDDASFEMAMEDYLDFVYNVDYSVYSTSGRQGAFYNPFRTALLNAFSSIKSQLLKASTVKLYDGNDLNPVTGAIVKGAGVPYIPYVDFYSKNETNKPYIFCDKDMKNTLENTWQGIAWERGSNIISGFDGFEPIEGRNATIRIQNYLNTDLRLDYGNDTHTCYIYFDFSNDYGSVQLRTPMQEPYSIHFRDNAQWIVNYIPMTDLKLKVDNQRDKNDIQLYNQNGKITDNVALSKLIHSYSKEISSDKITKYIQFRGHNVINDIGRIYIDNNNEQYVATNISYDFTQHEYSDDDDFDYFVECEFTLCKYVSTKSMLVNPNTNIRDYGIPQYFNVKRKQVYRDYYELAYETYSDANQENPYLNYTLVWSFPNYTHDISNYIGVMKINYDRDVNSSRNWYYQLETTTYFLDKMMYVVLDFNDNNIIGYGNQNVYSGFVVSRIFSGQIDTYNTPISYVDYFGEFKGIDILLCDNEQITSIYKDYQNDNGGSSWTGSLFNYSVFIPQDIYDAAVNYHTIRITESTYYKDALEIPVFEYALQIGDSKDVIIGDNILLERNNCRYFYSFRIASENEIFTPNNVVDNNSIQATQIPAGWQIQNGVKIEEVTGVTGYKLLSIYLYNSLRYDVNSQSWYYGNDYSASNTQGKDIAIFRHALSVDTGQEIASDLLFICRRVPNTRISGNRIILDINYYKLK